MTSRTGHTTQQNTQQPTRQPIRTVAAPAPDRMGPLDAAFLHLEDRHTSLHIGSLAIFEGPAPSQDEVRAAISRKLPLVPRYRQRMRTVPFGLARPVWADYAAFDLEQHLHRRALPSPGGDDELRRLVDEIMSRRLDRDLPLWEDWVVEGLAGDRWAFVTKVHHSMVDGIAGTDLLSTVFDSSPGPDPVPADHWAPVPEPSAVALTRQAVGERVGVPLREVRGVAHAARAARATAGTALVLGRGLVAFAGASRPFSTSSLAGPIGADRTYRWTEVPLADVLRIREALGGTVNDVVLAAVARAFRDLLLSRGEDPGRHTLRTLVPVSVRRPDQRGQLDNKVSAILAELPVDRAEPVDRLHETTRRMRALKATHEADTGEAVTELADLLPPPLLAAGLHVAFRLPHRVLTTVTTNVPGPRTRLWFAGRRMLATYPYVPIADRIRIGVAVTSYDGRLLFGFTGDAATCPDLAVLVRGLDAGVAELLAATPPR